MCPSVNHYNSIRVIKKGKVFLPIPYPSKEYKSFKKEFEPYLKQIVEESNWDIEPTKDNHYYLDIDMYFDRTDKDSCNYLKCNLDVANGIIYHDDRMILPRINRVYYTYNQDVKPHFEYELYAVSYIGIWEDSQEYALFITKCQSCRNYKEGNCGRLKDFMAYKITKDFDWNSRECLGFKEKKL